jgi:hypothetical protein
LHNNEYDMCLIEKPLNQGKQKNDTYTDPQNQKIKWITFTYYGKETRKVTKLFRDTKLKVAYCTRNTISNILKSKPHKNKYDRSEINCMKCLDCPKNILDKREEPSVPDIRSIYTT